MENTNNKKRPEVSDLKIENGKIYLNDTELKSIKAFKLEKNKAGITEFTPTLYVKFKNLDY